jgi:predicted 3-demethylubiquinone-9 3-methyltransferase (glyoxalase superfamily)
MTIKFQLEGQEFMALNGGPIFKFTEAISFIVNCKTQKEVDRQLSEGGDEKAQQCGRLTRGLVTVRTREVGTIINSP